MKIMVVTPYFYPSTGGLENYSLHMVRQLSDLGNEVFVVTSRDDGQKEFDTLDGIKIIRLPILFKLGNTPINPSWIFKIKKIINNEKPDLINAHTPVPFISDIAVARAGRVTTVLTYYNDLVKEKGLEKYLAKAYYILFINRTLRKCDGIVAMSTHYANASPYLKKYINKIKIVPPGVDFKTFNTSIDKVWLRKKYQNKKIVLFVGNMKKTHSHKGIECLINAFAKAQKREKDLRLILVGGGDAIPNYKAITVRLGVERYVNFTGYVPDRDLVKYYSGAHMTVLPSLTSAEGFGMVLLESQACGTPVIGSRIGGIPATMENGKTGYLVGPGDVIDLAVHIQLLAKDKNVMGAHAAAFVKKTFDWDRLGLLYRDILAESLRPKLVHVTPYYPPHLGGMENVAEAVCSRLAKRGWNVSVLTSNIGPSISRDIGPEQGIKIVRLSAFEIANLPMMWNLLPSLSGSITKKTIVHVHVAQAFIPEVAALVAKIKHATFIAHFHLDVDPSGKFGFLFELYKRTLFPIMLRSADRVIVFGVSQADLVVNKYGVERNKVVVIPNGIDSRSISKIQHSIHKNPHILYVGRLTLQKNVSLLLEALKGHSENYNTTIVGDGDQLKPLTELKTKYDLKNITFVGRKSFDECLDYYKKSDVLILPSIKEGMPLVILEAMASGLPVIGSDIPGISDLIDDKRNGLIFKENSPEDLHQALISLLSSPLNYSKISLASYEFSKQFYWDNIVNQFEFLYMNLFMEKNH
jgi:glycosyltransferase involved in cell wall biosynthesis